MEQDKRRVPAAPWDPTTLVTRARAAQASPAGTDDVEVDDVDELPADVEDPVTGVDPPPFEEQAERHSATTVNAGTRLGRDHRRARRVVSDRCDRRDRRDVDVLRS